MRTKTSVKPPWWVELEARFALITPSDLPQEPWVLRYTAAGQAMSPTGGPFTKVTNNENYLKHLKADLAEGPDGPRGHVVVKDLEDLKNALERTSANHGTAERHRQPS